MPLYFFDTHDGEHVQDDEGRECVDFDAARLLALQTLPEIVRWAVSKASDRQTYMVLVRDEGSNPVYRTTLTLEGQRLGPEGALPSD